ncbi:helix-turn-helix domain-containing protein [Sansalvadorimonas verongulae]|uniref:helix-turn-helix domain-containing protein n=1 Tax=Sansalvadorimonas verongulae TaxID=2172824 RepID=UPI0012BC1FC7|nr:hypothetical protein [Sansalvadorimonas verongulae]MTI12177.1 hypothetical protein [Sansalvadorimonas verongulae]
MIKVIKTEQDHAEAMARLLDLMDSNFVEGSAEENELEVLSILIEKYEAEHLPMDNPDPIEAIKFRMDQQGLSRKDMVPYFGSQTQASEVLNGKRPLTLAMIRKLYLGLGIPADILIHKPQLTTEVSKFGIS